MLSQRQQAILRIIVGEYITTTVPISSASIVGKYGLSVSSATIRNDMADLEEEGYITHPHTSAGRIPASKGYRYFVERLMGDLQLPLAERHMINHQFHQIERELDQWVRLAASVLAGVVHNAAVVSSPRTVESHLRQIELVPLQDVLALMIVILQEAILKHQVLSLDQPVSQDDLKRVANKLNALYAGLTAREIQGSQSELSPVEAQVVGNVIKGMQTIDQQTSYELYLDGLRHVLGQPEFASGEKMRQLVELFEQRSTLSGMLPELPEGDGVQVVIGDENLNDPLRECSIVLARYGVSEGAGGIVAVVGPTRMPYWRTISAVKYLSLVMSGLMGDLYH
ncbi:MAG: heat-inducible transcriptional repressor HrcA [Dehalococcoidia bacterium]|nr:heat-inducible transcriptional repressor HrcA [Dehalococcoidia bacterium]